MSSHRRLPGLLLAAGCLLIALLPAASRAAVFNVTTSAIDAHDADKNDGVCNDGAGNCTLRAAIEQADKLGGTNTINVPAGTYKLTAAFGPLTTDNQTNILSINGTGGAGTVIIDGQNATSVIKLGGNGSQVNLDNLVVQNGYFLVADPGGYGLCAGAGINVVYSVTVSVTNSVIQNNVAENGSGGGICINFGMFTLDRSTVRNNSATFGGGGIRITSGAPPGHLIITNSLISDNTVPGTPGNNGSSQAGAIVSQATIDISNTTFSGNHVLGAGSVLLGASGAKTTMRNVTMTNNTSGSGQIYLGSAELITFESTIIANSGPGPNCGGSQVAFVSAGHNLENGNSCNLTAPTDLVNVNPSLGPLQNNGGPTQTHALLAGSLAIDHGSNSLNSAFDQRGTGFARVSGAAADIGAFEFQGQGGAATLDVDASGVATKYDALTDGLLVLRYLFGITSTPLTQSALGGTATRTDPAVVKTYLDSIRNALDIDGNGTPDASTDGLMILRYLFGIRGDALIAGALGVNAVRNTAAAVEAQISLLVP